MSASTPSPVAGRPPAPALVPDVLDAAAALKPLAGEWIERWTLPSGATVFVTKPQGATEARPILLAVHGAEDRPDWACSEWRATVRGFAWVLCPQGTPLRSAYAWGSAEQIAALGFEARDELVRRYGAYVAEGPLLYGGFSQGATLAFAVTAAHPGAFRGVVMVEAGHTPLSAAGVIYGLKKGGISRAVVSCSTTGCRSFSKDLVTAAKHASFDLLTNDAGLRGHVFDGPVAKTLGDTLVRLVEGDARWSGLVGAVGG